MVFLQLSLDSPIVVAEDFESCFGVAALQTFSTTDLDLRASFFPFEHSLCIGTLPGYTLLSLLAIMSISQYSLWWLTVPLIPCPIWRLLRCDLVPGYLLDDDTTIFGQASSEVEVLLGLVVFNRCQIGPSCLSLHFRYRHYHACTCHAHPGFTVLQLSLSP